MWKLTLFSVLIINTFETDLATSSVSHVPWHPQPPLSAVPTQPRPAKPDHSAPILIPAIIQLPATIKHTSHLSHAVLVPLSPKQYPQLHQQRATPVVYPSHRSPVHHYPPPPPPPPPHRSYPPPPSPLKGNLPPHYTSPLLPPSKYALPHSNAAQRHLSYKYPPPHVPLPPPKRYLPPVAGHISGYPPPPPVLHKEPLAKNTYIPAKNAIKGTCPMVRLPICAASCTRPLRTFYNICFMRLFNLRNKGDYRVIQYGHCKFLNYDGKKAMKGYPYAGGDPYPAH